MITKNYTADRTETPGEATSTIPAAMANYWINGVNSLISDLTPLKDAGGFYAPVDKMVYKITSTTDLSNGLTLPITKLTGKITPSSNKLTLPKGYVYEFNLDLGTITDNNSFFSIFQIYNGSSDLLQLEHRVVGNLTSYDFTGNAGYGVLDLTSSGSNMDIWVMCNYLLGSGKVSNGWGGLHVTQYKIIPFTAAT